MVKVTKSSTNRYSSVSHHAQFDIYHIDRDQENCNIKVSATLDNHQAGCPVGPTLIITYTYIFHTSQRAEREGGMGHGREMAKEGETNRPTETEREGQRQRQRQRDRVREKKKPSVTTEKLFSQNKETMTITPAPKETIVNNKQP